MWQMDVGGGLEVFVGFCHFFYFFVPECPAVSFAVAPQCRAVVQ